MLTLDRRIELTNRLCYLFVIFLIGCLTGWIYEEIKAFMEAIFRFTVLGLNRS